jgi:CheY-like chemotaxis protein/anti-sigma regulatory factor (Ser/Thr protein kinase)
LRLRVRSPRSLWLDTDPVVASRILSNLVANALRYTHEGGVLVGCRRRADRRVEIQVVDTGIGVEPAEQARIFGEFYQVADVVRSRERGMGLGLAIAQRSAQLLDGAIVVRSVPGRGSMFSLTLPLAEPPAAAASASPHEAARAGEGVVLVIDDDTQLIEAMRRLLGEWGYEAITADSVDTALEAVARAQGVGLILTDYQLAAHQSGIDAILAVRDYLGPEIPAIIITGDTSAVAAHDARAHGVPMLLKPVDPVALHLLIDKATQAFARRNTSEASEPA